MDKATLEASLTETKAMITETQAAISALTVGGAQSYSLNTGQSTQTVTKLNISALKTSLSELYYDCSVLEAALNGATIIGRARG